MPLLPVDRGPAPGRTVAPSAARPPGPEQFCSRTPHVLTPLVVGCAGLLTGVFVAALLVGGGAPTAPLPGLADAGALTGWGGPLVDLLARLLAVLTIGQLAYAALLAPTSTGASAGASSALRGTTWSAAGWLLAEVCALVLTASSLYAVPVTQLSVQAVMALPTQLPTGQASLWAGALLAVVVVGSTWLGGRPAGDRRGQIRGGAALLLLAALGAAIAPVALAGHSSAAEDHVTAVLALSVHVVTASLWAGGLAGLLLHGRDRREVVAAVRRFSSLALGCVVLMLLSGAVAAVLVAGPPSWSWTGEGWARLLSAKTVLLGLLATIGWEHRRRTMPALGAGRPHAFVRLGVVEVALMMTALTLSVALAASPAPTPTAEAPGTASPGSAPAVGDAPSDRPVPRDDASEAPEASAPITPAPVEDMSGHDHGELSVGVLVDEDRFHVTGTVRPGQRVTVYNSSDSAATITALDGSFDIDAPARTFITFTAPAEAGDHDFVNRRGGDAVDGFADTLRVRTPATDGP